MSNNWTVTNTALEKLPLFATDKELAVAIVGPKRAAEWLRTMFPRISTLQGFPKFDSAHSGWPVIKVAKFYEGYIGATGPGINAVPDGKEKVWIGKRIENRIDKEERFRADGVEFEERDFGPQTPEVQKAIAEYRAKKRAEIEARKAR
ncbi:hypothetical protein [Mesorhizobium sp. 1M-11]|uniref:hypothetical protein n=1 Tax=Mesorhizobium sp. 1M-11 TaxID=1529006 RepID=UPI000AA7FCAA|nr:hypothetical protein [Mesorhizobium sp. 1M-11]